jgi:hypothetical protein
MRRGLDHGREVGVERVVAAAQVLYERMPAAMLRADGRRLSPRIVRSLAFNRPWSASMELFAYRSAMCRAGGAISSTI